MEHAFLAMLQAQGAVTALVGAGVAARIYPFKLPQSPVFPAITYQVISGPRDYTQDGDDGVPRFRIQMNCYGQTYAEAKALRDALVDSISGLNNQAYGSPPLYIMGVFVMNERDRYEVEQDADPAGAPYRKILDLSVTVAV